MPKILTYYVCEICNCHCDTELDAIDCEKVHVGIKSAHAVAYDGLDNRYPESIYIQFIDGHKIAYWAHKR